MGKDTLLAVLISLLLMLGGCLKDGCLPFPTFVSPEIGFYSGENLRFQVIQSDRSNAKLIIFSIDHYRYDNILVIGGSFYRRWGENGGTHCPTDAYIIRGKFTSPNTAEGWIRYGYNCKFGEKRQFKVKLEGFDD